MTGDERAIVCRKSFANGSYEFPSKMFDFEVRFCYLFEYFSIDSLTYPQTEQPFPIQSPNFSTSLNVPNSNRK